MSWKAVRTWCIDLRCSGCWSRKKKLGLTKEQLDETERQIATIKDIGAKQLETVAVLRADGHPFERVEHALSNLLDLLPPVGTEI